MDKTPNNGMQHPADEKDRMIHPARNANSNPDRVKASPVREKKPSASSSGRSGSSASIHKSMRDANTKKHPLSEEKKKIKGAGSPSPASESQNKRSKIAFWSLIGVTFAVILCFVVYVSFFRVDRIEETPLVSDNVELYDPSTALQDLTYRVPDGFTYPEGIQEKFKALYAANQDFVGWLSIPNTTVDCAVYQADDNSYYLKKDLSGNYSRYGTVFMDAYDDVANMKRNTVIYGHNFDDDGDGGYEDIIFGDIHQFLDVDFYRTTPVIEFDTIYRDYKWKVIGCFYTNGSSTGDNDYLFYYIATGMNDENFMDFIDEVNQRSYIHTAVDVQPTDKILTLSTCTYFFDRGGSLENARCVLVARMVRDGESEEVDVAAATQNENPRYPQLYYDVFGGENPYRDESKWVPEE